MGDFVKGSLPQDYPTKITQGLQLHRRIDSFAHNNQHTRRSRQRLTSKYGHGRGIIVDIFYDHFMAEYWSDYSNRTLSSYAEEVYQLLQEKRELLPEELQQIVPRMIKHNWLVSYQYEEVVGRALQRIAQRLSRQLPLEKSLYELIVNKELFRQDFREFMTEATAFANQELESY